MFSFSFYLLEEQAGMGRLQFSSMDQGNRKCCSIFGSAHGRPWNCVNVVGGGRLTTHFHCLEPLGEEYVNSLTSKMILKLHLEELMIRVQNAEKYNKNKHGTLSKSTIELIITYK